MMRDAEELFERGDYFRAIEVLNRLPDQLKKYEMLSKCFLKTEMYTDAEFSLEKCIVYDNNNISFIRALTDIKIKNKKYKEALTSFDLLLHKSPSDSTDYLRAANTARYLGETNQEREYLLRASGLPVGKGFHNAARALAFLRLGNYERAVNELIIFPIVKFDFLKSIYSDKKNLESHNILPDPIVINNIPDSMPLLMISGDVLYLEKFWPKFVEGILKRSPDTHIVVHAIGSGPVIERLAMRARMKGDITLIHDPIQTTSKALFACLRYIRLPLVIRLSNRGVLLLDIDSHINKDLSPLFTRLSQRPFMLFFREWEYVINQTYAAGFSYFGPKSLRACDGVSRYLGLLIKSRSIFWFADQLALTWLSMFALDADDQGYLFRRRPDEGILSFDPSSQTSFITTLKGAAKNI